MINCPRRCPCLGSLFKALDQLLDLPPGASIEQVMTVMEGHVLDAAEVMGRYAREFPDA
ncbi:MAG: hypothetical protein PUP91_38945 [Rhizonema sp. PD37]|nr:hypothetical protein [Rhizonema sp. PD37]